MTYTFSSQTPGHSKVSAVRGCGPSALRLSAAALTRPWRGFPTHLKQCETRCRLYKIKLERQPKQVPTFIEKYRPPRCERISGRDWKELIKKQKILSSDNFTSFSENLLPFNEAGDWRRCVVGKVYARNLTSRPNSKKMSWPYIKSLAHGCTFTCLKLKSNI